MSRLVARLLFCMFMFPVAVVLYCATVLTLERILQTAYYGDRLNFEIAGLVSFAFVIAYWTLLWRKTVRWNLERIAITVVAAVIGASILFGADFIPFSDDLDHHVLLAILIPALWLITAVYFWRETPAERAQRIAASGRANVSCPTCGYNLTGLAEARCPECGSRFTLDELLIAQHEQVVGEIE